MCLPAEFRRKQPLAPDVTAVYSSLTVRLADARPLALVIDRGAFAGAVRTAAMMTVIHAPFTHTAGARRGRFTRRHMRGKSKLLQKSRHPRGRLSASHDSRRRGIETGTHRQHQER